MFGGRRGEGGGGEEKVKEEKTRKGLPLAGIPIFQYECAKPKPVGDDMPEPKIIMDERFAKKQTGQHDDKSPLALWSVF